MNNQEDKDDDRFVYDSSDGDRTRVQYKNPGMGFRMASDESRPAYREQQQRERESWRALRRGKSAMPVVTHSRQDYGPAYEFVDEKKWNRPEIWRPDISDQSYWPAYQAHLQSAGPTAIQAHEDTRSKNSGMFPEPGDRMSFGQAIVRGGGDKFKGTGKTLKDTIDTSRYLLNQGKGYEKEAQAALEHIQGRQAVEEHPLKGWAGKDDYETFQNIKENGGYLIGKYGTQAVMDAALSMAPLPVQFGVRSGLNTGKNFAERYRNTGETRLGEAAVYGATSAALESVPMTSRQAPRVLKVGENVLKETGSGMLHQAMTQPEVQGRQMLKDSEALKPETWLGNLIYSSVYGGR